MQPVRNDPHSSTRRIASAEGVPKVTFGIPVYNGERFLSETLDSLLSQDGSTRFEIVISDNASDDRTADICRDYESRFDNVRCFRQPFNRGAAANYRAVLAMARGEYFKWNAADDLIHPTYLNAAFAALEKTPSAQGVFMLALYVDEAGRPLYSAEDVAPLMPWPSGTREQALRVLDALFSDGKQAMVITMGMFKTTLVRSIRPMGNYQAADWVTALELALTGELLYLTDYPRAFFRVHPGSSSFRDLTDYMAVQRFFDPSVRSRTAIAFQRKRRFLELMRSGFLPSVDRGTSAAVVLRVLSLSTARAKRQHLDVLPRWRAS